ncbi:MAG: glycosyltransferase [Oscillospiraceae bacterium]|jgi:glycosyltransferase involved in cell wall biosynthesis|nr:glycosyltransferase [Oscillospiraceae bacterium]
MPSKNPAVTVVVPAYNAQRDLRRCLDSLLAQTLRTALAIEILVIDDGSTDRTHAIALEYANREPGAVRLHRQVNAGPSAARNRGIALAQGEYVGFVDSDDWVEPPMYERLYAACTAGDAEIGGCGILFDGVRKVELPGSTGEARVFSQREVRETLLTQGMASVLGDMLLVNKIFRRDFLLALPYQMPEHLRLGEDNYFMMRCLADCSAFATAPGLFYHYVTRPGSLSHTAPAGLTENRLQQYAHFAAFRREIGIDTAENRSIYAVSWLGMLLEACGNELRLATGHAAFYARMIDLAACPEVQDAMAAVRPEALAEFHLRSAFHTLFTARDWAGLEQLLRREARTERLRNWVRSGVYYFRYVFKR